MRKKPSNKWYIIPITLVLIGVISISAVIMDSYVSSDSKKMEAPGTANFVFNKTGKYSIYYEYKSDYKGREYNASCDRPGMTILIQEENKENSIAVQTSSGMNYTIGNNYGYLIKEFRIPTAGQYKITVGSDTKTPFVLKFSEGSDFKLFIKMFFGIGLSVFIFMPALRTGLAILVMQKL